MSIVKISDETLRRIENNDPNLTYINVVSRDYTDNQTVKGYFWLHNGADVSRLGNAIANNTHLKSIELCGTSEWMLATTLDTAPLFEGLQRSTTIKLLSLKGDIGIGILYEFVANSSSITNITLLDCDLRWSVLSRALAQAITKCPNLKVITMFHCNIEGASVKQFASGIKGMSCLQRLELIHGIDGTEDAKAIAALFEDPNCSINDLKYYKAGFIYNECIQTIVDRLTGNTKLVKLDLSGNSMNESGCESIVRLLQDPSCNLTCLDLNRCGLDSESVTKIVRSLIGNSKLEHLGLSSNNEIGLSGPRSDSRDSITALLEHPNCNVNKMDLSRCGMDNMCAVFLVQALEGNNKLTCLDLSDNEDITELGWSAFSILLSSNCSNHTLLSLGERNGSSEDFLPCNLASLLKLNRAVDMEPWFELDSEDDERNLKALPSVIDWFDRCASRLARNGDVEYRRIVNSTNARKLSAMFQFALAMPLEFVPSQSVMLRLHKEAKVQLKEKSLELERQIASKEAEIRSMIKAKKELDDEIKTKNETIKNWASDSVG